MPRKHHALAPLGLDRPAEPLFADSSPIVIGSDYDLEVLGAARDNARAAGVTKDVTWQRADVSTLKPQVIADIQRERGREPGPGLILSNPPYGERLDEHDLRELYGALGNTLRGFAGWRAGFLVGTPLFEEVLYPIIGEPRIKKPLANANLRAYFYLYEL
jgi:putative N6-adenine-specific DNA methylase